MTSKEYCSTVCQAQCCKAHGPIVWPPACPNLTADNLCSNFEKRIGFKFEALTKDGHRGTCVCSKPAQFLKHLPQEVLAQCCIAHPELLLDTPSTEPRS